MVFLPRQYSCRLCVFMCFIFLKVPHRATILQKYVHIGTPADSCPLLKKVAPIGRKTDSYLYFMHICGERPKTGNGRVRTRLDLLPPPNRRRAGMKPFHRFQILRKDSTQRSASPWRRPTGSASSAPEHASPKAAERTAAPRPAAGSGRKEAYILNRPRG